MTESIGRISFCLLVSHYKFLKSNKNLIKMKFKLLISMHASNYHNEFHWNRHFKLGLESIINLCFDNIEYDHTHNSKHKGSYICFWNTFKYSYVSLEK